MRRESGGCLLDFRVLDAHPLVGQLGSESVFAGLALVIRLIWCNLLSIFWCSAEKLLDDDDSRRYRRVRLLQCTKAQEPPMSVIERSQSFVKEMNELNVKAVTQYFEIQREAVEQFVGANRARFTALREVKGLEDVISAQREYYAAVQKNVADSVKKQADLVRENFTTGSKLVRELFNRDNSVSQA
jgi:hypothetical protein